MPSYPLRSARNAKGKLPLGGFRELSAGAERLCVVAPLAGAARELGLLEPGGLERLFAQSEGHEGRTRSAVVPLPERAEQLHLRRVRHGGWLAGLWGGSLLGLRRPLAELDVTARLAAAGAPVPRPALVWGRRRAGLLWIAALGTVHEEDAVDGLAFLRSAPDRRRLLRAAAALGDAVRRLHAAGGRHADLHIRNVLVRESGETTHAVLVDLDRGRVVRQVSPRARAAELMRLYRSLVKHGLEDAVGRGAKARFLAAYTTGDRRLRCALRPHLARQARCVALHALGYRHRSR